MKYPHEMSGARMFMSKLASEFTDSNKAFILVSHINPTSVPLIESLNKKGRIAGIIAKPNSINYPTYEKLFDKYRFLNLDKYSLLEPEVVEKQISPLSSKDEKLIILDIGGYFAGALEELNTLPNLAGIVEDTENGLQKYEKALKNFSENKVPIVSIARSRTKDFEDYLIGRSIAYSAIRILKKEKVKNWKNLNIGIIGFGEVGRGAAFYFKDTLGLNVSVYDSNPIVQNKIALSGFKPEEREKLLSNSEILIAATGHGSLRDEDIKLLNKGCYVASCTSGDDEFAFEKFDISSGSISEYKTATKEGIHFINGGNAVNFMHPEQLERLLSPYIYLTHSALLNAAVKIDVDENLKTKEVNALSEETEKEIIGGFRSMLKNSNKNSVFIDKFLLAGLGRK